MASRGTRVACRAAPEVSTHRWALARTMWASLEDRQATRYIWAGSAATAPRTSRTRRIRARHGRTTQTLAPHWGFYTQYSRRWLLEMIIARLTGSWEPPPVPPIA